MSSFTDAARRKLIGILVVVGAMWVVYLLSCIFPLVEEFGLRPRSLRGLVGIVTMPFLHAHVGHLLANTIPLLVLLGLLSASRAHAWWIVAGISLLGGSVLWLSGRNVIHVGASVLISGLITFLVLRGWFERRVHTVIVAVATFLLYGGTLFWGVIPTDPLVSWDGHLCGALAGGVVAFGLARSSRSKRPVRKIAI